MGEVDGSGIFYWASEAILATICIFMEDPVRYKFLNIVQPVVVCMQRLSLHQWHEAAGVVPCENPMIDAQIMRLGYIHGWGLYRL